MNAEEWRKSVEAEEWRKSLGAEGLEVITTAKRCGLAWDPATVGDWFVSYSPCNGSSHAEGPWDHWVDFALQVLSHPLTEAVRPGVYDVSLVRKVKGFHVGAGHSLTDEELRDCLGSTVEESGT